MVPHQTGSIPGFTCRFEIDIFEQFSSNRLWTHPAIQLGLKFHRRISQSVNKKLPVSDVVKYHDQLALKAVECFSGSTAKKGKYVGSNVGITGVGIEVRTFCVKLGTVLGDRAELDQVDG